jgi:catalase
MAEKNPPSPTAPGRLADNQISMTPGLHGPVLLQKYQLIEKLAKPY